MPKSATTKSKKKDFEKHSELINQYFKEYEAQYSAQGCNL